MSHEESSKTVKQRSAMKDINVDSEFQLQSELKGNSKSAREDLLKTELTADVTGEQSLVMKADLGILQWNKLKA